MNLTDDSTTLEDATFTIIRRRILPLAILLYMFAYLDRVNLSFASLQMNKDLGYSTSVYGFGAGVFFVGYFLFEVPSNIILARIGARLWIARIMFTWGIVASLMIFVKTPTSFYLLRFLLGAAEAGFFPGMIFYLECWFPVTHRARVVALFMTATAFAGALGAPLSGAILQLDGVWHLTGWKWLFLIEGVPSIFLAFVVMQKLPNGPAQAMWLTPSQQNWVINRLEKERAKNSDYQISSTFWGIFSIRVWLLCLIGFTMILGMYGFGFWVPQIIKEVFHLDNFRTALLTAIPYVTAGFGMVLIGMHSDRIKDRQQHVAVSALLAVLGFIVSACSHHSVLIFCGLCLAACGIWAMLGPFWAWSTPTFTAQTSAAGIAIISSFVNLGGFVGPYIVGIIKSSDYGFKGGLLALAGTLLIGGAATSLVQMLDKSNILKKYPKDVNEESKKDAEKP